MQSWRLTILFWSSRCGSGTMPALVKAFLEQVMRPGVAFSYEKYGAKKLLAGRSAHIVITMGMPAWLYQTFFCSHAGCAEASSGLPASRLSGPRCSA
jgi:Flavodoxin-like fold